MGGPLPGDGRAARRVRRVRVNDARQRSARRRLRRSAPDRRGRAARALLGGHRACPPNSSAARRGGRRASRRSPTSSGVCSSRTSRRSIPPTSSHSCRSGDPLMCSRHAGGDLAPALRRIDARTVVAAFSHDNWFPAADCRAEQQLIANSSFRVIESVWGHYAWGATAGRDGTDRSDHPRRARYMTSR